MMASPPTSPRRVFIFSTPRTTSNMFMKIFYPHSALKISDYPFMYASMAGPEANITPWAKQDPETKAVMDSKYADLTFAKAWQSLQDHIESAEKEGKISFVKEHCVNLIQPQLDHTSPRRAALPPLVLKASGPEPQTPKPNPTFLPSSFLLKHTPVFIIRNPARMVPSLMRASQSLGASTTDEHFLNCCSYRWPRLIYDWYRACYSDNGPWPVVLDGDDLINNTVDVVGRLCELLEIDPKEAQFEWESVNTAGQPKFLTSFLGSLQKSSGVVKDEKTAKVLNVDEEAVFWAKEFGEEDASNMVKIAKGAMEDYEYLKQFRIGSMN